MANRIFYEADCDISKLDGKTVAIIGYGSQGHAHALNLKESGVNVIIGLYEGSRSWKKAEEQGMEVYTAAEAAKKADISTMRSRPSFIKNPSSRTWKRATSLLSPTASTSISAASNRRKTSTSS